MARRVEIVFVSSNIGKINEVKSILPGITIVSSSLSLPELQGEPEEIVAEKLKLAYEAIRKPVIVEDTSLAIEAFSGLPGPYIKHFLTKMGTEKLSRLSILAGEPKATASCIFGYMDQDCVKLFRGEITGIIVPPRGANGFGWDSIFQPEGFNETFGEMGHEKKNRISHRKLAIEKMRPFFEKG